MTRGVFPDLDRASALVADRGGLLGRPLHLLATTTSTNDLALHAAKIGAPHGATWLSEQQTAGRGRRGRSWSSVPGESLLFSVLLRVSCPATRLPCIALLAGLAVRDAAAAAAPAVRVGIKWPNDVVTGGRKLAGVLVEAVTRGSRVEAVAVGIGINVHTRTFPADIEDRATSLALAAQAHPPDRAAIFADTLAALDRDLEVVLSRGLGLVRARLEAADDLRGRHVRSDTGDSGLACGIDDEGRLVIRRENGEMARLGSGEVHLGAS